MLERGEGPPQEKVPDEAPDEAPVSLSGEINSATRNLHTTLNRLITSRLPLALPPHASDPSLYTTGLLHFAHIFLTFESLWADITRDHGSRPASTAPSSDPSPASPPMSPLLSYLLVNPYDSPSFFTPTLGAPTQPSLQLVSFLQTVRPWGLIRSARLKKDLESLLGLHPTDLEVVLAKYPGDKVAEFCVHIRRVVHEKPWTLVSYAWCFYMAVFSGGRWIRAGLLRAGPEFWQAGEQSEKTMLLAERVLSFWHFPGQFDGEDIKLEFKAHLAAAEALFPPDERVDIIEEAKTIFHLCATLVEELDEMVESSSAETNAKDEPTGQSKMNAEKEPLTEAKSVAPTSSDRIIGFVRRPEVTGTLVALSCFACVTLLRLQ